MAALYNDSDIEDQSDIEDNKSVEHENYLSNVNNNMNVENTTLAHNSIETTGANDNIYITNFVLPGSDILLPCSDSDFQLYNFLKSIDACSAFMFLKDRDYNEERLKYLSEADINFLIPEKNYGIRSELRGKISKWRTEKFGESNTCSLSSTITDWIKNQPSFSESGSPISQYNIDNSTALECDVRSILQSSEKGRYILKEKETKKLNPQERIDITHLIVDHFLLKQLELKKATFYKLRSQIIELFPTEEEEYYYKEGRKGKRQSGYLYHRYVNSRHKQIKTGLSTINKAFPLDISHTEINEELCEQYRKWLYFNIGPKEEVISKWKSSFLYRRNKIKQYTTNSELLSEWPSLKQADAPLLGTHNDTYEIPPKHKANSLSNSNSLNSNNYLKFWKTDSQSPMMTTKTERNMRLNKLYKIFCQYSKWPLILLLICGILGLIIYFIVLEINNADIEKINNNKLIVNKKMTFEETLVFGNYLNNYVDHEKNSNTNYDREKDINSINTGIINGHAANYNVTGIPIESNNIETNFPSFGVHSTEFNVDDTTTENLDDYDEIPSKTVLPDKENQSSLNPTRESFQLFGFTSGHQNNFGVPIEEDERWLTLLHIIQSKNNTDDKSHTPTTDSSVYRTRVSPTLPIISKYEITTQGIKKHNNTDDEMCQSTSLSLCRGVLHYDLTTPDPTNSLTSTDFSHFRHLIDSQCSLRVAQFVCAVLEPECRPTKMGTLKPCKRICKAVLEPCAHIIASSEILTSTFDCDSYPNSDDANVCEDPTRRAACYGNEFKCLDKTCIPIQWKCDNIKDCADGEDEEKCKFCEQDEFRCPTNDKCIPDKWRCDRYEDCPDAADEYDCFDYEDDAHLFPDFATSRSFPVVHEQLPNKPNSRPYLTISGEDRLNSAENRKYEGERDSDVAAADDDNDDEDPIYLVSSKNVVSIYNQSDTEKSNEVQKTAESKHSAKQILVSKNLEHFQDSKEIMMTSDSEADYKYTSTDFPVASTSHASPCPENELRCISGLCISTSQLCDKVTDCPDGADEAMCVYEN